MCGEKCIQFWHSCRTEWLVTIVLGFVFHSPGDRALILLRVFLYSVSDSLFRSKVSYLQLQTGKGLCLVRSETISVLSVDFMKQVFVILSELLVIVCLECSSSASSPGGDQPMFLWIYRKRLDDETTLSGCYQI